MKPLEDAHGQQILKYYNHEISFSVVERDDGYVNLDNDGAALYLSDYKNWKKHEKEAIRYAKYVCLDIGCAAGRVLLYLQKRERNAIGIDVSPLAIKIAKIRGARDARVMGIDNVGRFKPDSFDTIIMFGHNFGLLGSKNKAKILLKKIFKITSDDAVIIAETRDPYITDNPVHFKYHEMNRRRGRMPGQLRIRVRFMQYATKWYDYLYVSKKEMKDLLKGTGWEVKKFIDSDKYKENGLYIAVMKKM
jgi:SAM-dependent methyltransferase